MWNIHINNFLNYSGTSKSKASKSGHKETKARLIFKQIISIVIK